MIYMIGRERERFSKCVLYIMLPVPWHTSTLATLKKTPYIAMIDSLGIPHSSADLQWPDLARLICPASNERVSEKIQLLLIIFLTVCRIVLCTDSWSI